MVECDLRGAVISVIVAMQSPFNIVPGVDNSGGWGWGRILILLQVGMVGVD
jgi:hypothetical protein